MSLSVDAFIWWAGSECRLVLFRDGLLVSASYLNVGNRFISAMISCIDCNAGDSCSRDAFSSMDNADDDLRRRPRFPRRWLFFLFGTDIVDDASAVCLSWLVKSSSSCSWCPPSTRPRTYNPHRMWLNTRNSSCILRAQNGPRLNVQRSPYNRKRKEKREKARKSKNKEDTREGKGWICWWESSNLTSQTWLHAGPREEKKVAWCRTVLPACLSVCCYLHK